MLYRLQTSSTPSPTFILDLLMHRCPQIHLRQHLRQYPVPQPQRRIAKSLQPQPLQQARIHQRAADNDLRPPRPDPRHRRPLRVVHLRQLVSQLANLPRSAVIFRLAPALLRQSLLLRPLAMCPLASASAAAVPDVATTNPTRGVPNFLSARRSSRSINCFNLATSSFAGGSLGKNSSCSRTAPSGSSPSS